MLFDRRSSGAHRGIHSFPTRRPSDLIATFMLLLDITIVNVALPKIATDLKANFSDIQWVIDAYALTLASLLLTTGTLADLFGRRLLFSIGLALFAFTSLLCALSPSVLFLILARAAQGVGGEIMFSTW